MPKMYIIAGPNGSGKTTFAREFLPFHANCPNFINADLIAQGLAPFSPSSVGIKAGRLLLEQIFEYVNKQADFAIESTLSGKTYYSLLKKVIGRGYSIHIFFLWVPNDVISKARIKERVSGGGHDVPSKDVERRFTRSMENFSRIYKDLCESWIIFDNSSGTPHKIAEREGNVNKIYQKEIVNKYFPGVMR